MRTKYIFSVLLLWLMALGQANAQLDITWPVNRMIFQRNGNSPGSATVYFAGQYFNGNYAVQYRTEKLEASQNVPTIIANTLTGWNNVSYNSNTTPNSVIQPFMGSFIRDAGLYRLDIQANGTIKSVFFGVGDVYLVAGQSNSSGFSNSGNGSDLNLVTFYDDGTSVEPEGISVYNLRANAGLATTATSNNAKYEGGRKRISFPIIEGFSKLTKDISNNNTISANGIFPTGLNSWCYAALGKKMITSTNPAISNIPVAFFNAGAPATWVQNWTESYDGGNTINPFGTNLYGGFSGIPYVPFRNTLQMFGNIMGVRSVLWHQGESDSEKRNGAYSEPNGPTPSFDFNITKNQMETLIEQSRQDYKINLNWAISKVSWWREVIVNDRRVNPELRNRQGEVANQSNNRLGAETDNIRMQDNGNQTRHQGSYNVHFSGYGLKLLADKWFDSQPWNATPISGVPLLSVELVANSSNSYTLKAPPNAQAYLWFRGSDLVNPYGFSKDLDVSGSDNEIFTCYVSFDADPNKQKFQACQPVYMKANIIVGGGCYTPPNLPTNLIVNQGTIVSGQTSVLSANCGNYATPLWSNSELVNSIAVSPTSTTIYTVKCQSNQYGSSCISNPVPLKVTVNPAPPPCNQTNLSSLSPINSSGEWAGWGSLQTNKSVESNTLTVGGYQTGNGIGTHAGSRLVYNLGGQYGTFSGSVGRDDEADNCGCGSQKVQFVIKADGLVLFTSSLLGTTDGKQTFSVDVAGKNQLELLVNDAGDNFYGDHADWLDAVLYCGSAPSCTTAPAPPTNVGASPASISSGGSSVLSASCATGTPTWSTGGAGNSITVTPTTTTNYSVWCLNGACPASNTVNIGVIVSSGACSAIVNNLVMGTWNVTGQQLVARYFNNQYWLTQRVGTNPDMFVVRGSGMLQRGDVSLNNGAYYNMVGCFTWTYSNWDNLGNPSSAVFTTPSNYSLSYSGDGTMIYTANGGGGNNGGNCTNAYVTSAWASATIGYGDGPKIGQRHDGGPMTVGGTTYAQGIGTHAGSEIVYNLGSHSYENFKASVGRDAGANGCNCGGQTMVFKVYNHSTGSLIGGPITKTINQGATDMVVPITGISAIRLVVEDGGDAYFGDWADWANARFA